MDALTRATLILNAAGAPASALEKLTETPDELWYGSETLWGRLSLRPSCEKKLRSLLEQPDWPEQEFERVQDLQARFIPINSPDYPARLRDLDVPPLGLYVRGNPEVLNSPSAGVVGTRKCSHYGASVAESLGRALAQAGYAVISGGALGIDAAGHKGCLASGGRTVAVLGTGLDRVYPSNHRELFRKIAEKGALISEYPMGTRGDPWRFPERNRIIVALAGRLIVVESPEDGGAMITARLALDIGREVWCVPGRITETVCRGTNLLLRDGAEPLVGIEDFIQCIAGRYGQLKIEFNPLPEPQPHSLTTDEKVILALLQRQGDRTADQLMEESGLDFSALQICLMSLQAGGLVLTSGPGRFSARA